MEKISLKQNLKESWELFKVNYKILLLSSFLMGIVSYVSNDIENIFLNLLCLIVSAILQIGFIKITLDILDNQKPKIEELFNPKNKFFKYIWMSILSVLIIGAPISFVGLLFLTGIFGTQTFSFASLGVSAILMTIAILGTLFFIIPRMMLANIALIDNNEKAFQSIKTSYFITKERKLQTIFLFFVIVFLNILGVIPFYLGLLVTIPISQLMLSKYYRQISGKLMPTTEEAPVDLVKVENTTV